MLIRDADPERDAVACAAIYAPYVSDSVISLELVPPTDGGVPAADGAFLTDPSVPGRGRRRPGRRRARRLRVRRPAQRAGRLPLVRRRQRVSRTSATTAVGSAERCTRRSSRCSSARASGRCARGSRRRTRRARRCTARAASSWSASTTGSPTSTARGVMSPGWSATYARRRSSRGTGRPPEPGPPTRLG